MVASPRDADRLPTLAVLMGFQEKQSSEYFTISLHCDSSAQPFSRHVAVTSELFNSSASARLTAIKLRPRSMLAERKGQGRKISKAASMPCVSPSQILKSSNPLNRHFKIQKQLLPAMQSLCPSTAHFACYGPKMRPVRCLEISYMAQADRAKAHLTCLTLSQSKSLHGFGRGPLEVKASLSKREREKSI